MALHVASAFAPPLLPVVLPLLPANRSFACHAPFVPPFDTALCHTRVYDCSNAMQRHDRQGTELQVVLEVVGATLCSLPARTSAVVKRLLFR